MARVERIICRRPYNGAVFSWSKLAPEETHAPCVRLAGDQNDGRVFFSLEGFANQANFIGCVHNGWLEYVNGVCRDAFVD